MKKDELLKKIFAKAKNDKKLRKSQRFLQVIGFFVAKGFLDTNYPVPKLPNKKIFIEDVLWAGTNVEPRLLEVLPAAMVRLGAHFIFHPEHHPDLAETVRALKADMAKGPDFGGIPYLKLRTWLHFPLKDRRMKDVREKRVTRTYRFHPKTINLLKQQATQAGCSETQLLESLVAFSSKTVA